MKRFYLVAGAAALGGCLVGWAALAWAQPDLGRLPNPSSAAPDPGRPEPTSVVVPSSGPKAAVRPGPGGDDRYRPVPSSEGTQAQAPYPLSSGATRAQADLPVTSAGSPTPVGAPPATVPAPALSAPGGLQLEPSTLPPAGGVEQGPAAPSSGGPGASIGAPSATALPPIGSENNSAAPAAPSTDLNASAGGEDQGTEAMPENGTGRPESSVCLEWMGTPAAKIGQPMLYTLAVRNTTSSSVHQVQVRVRIPTGLRVMATAPSATAEGVQLSWDLGSMQPREQKDLQLKLVAENRGDQTPQAWATFTSTAALRIRVREPKLVIKATGTGKALVGDQVAFTMTVTNPGDGTADQVKVHAMLSEGLEHARGNKIDFDIGNLSAGESRNVTLLCATRTGGAQKCEATAEADGGLTGRDTATINVITPKLNLQVIGPALRYLGRKAVYILKVTNPGDAPASNVTVSDVVPEGFKVLAASDGGRHDFSTRTVAWFVGEIGPQQSREVHLEVQALNPGEFKHKASASGARGLRATSELGTRVEGLSALLLEMVDTEDPIEVSSDTAYEVRITNTGSKMETDIRLVATIPDKMELKNAQGPVRYHVEGKRVVFDPIARLMPRADATFRINAKALEAGTVRFKIQMTSTNLVEPVIKMEATRIYSDAPETRSSLEATPQ